ncbi:MAG: galactose mutarotase [Rhodobacteraceae bacterium]|nr:galactose mutarotase [Paracoccaceae bacterium]
MSLPDIRPFGTTRDGRAVDLIRLRGGELTVTLLTLGATLHDLRLAGTPWPLTLGAGSVAAYEGPCRWFGAIAGPVANRIAGAQAMINGKLCRFEANEKGRTTLHGGATGTDAQVWTLTATTADSVTLTLELPDGLGGFPGNRQISACYRLTDPATLRLTLRATSDRPTLMNLANHSYWNLDGSDQTGDHRLRILADHYLPTDADGIPLPPAPVAGTAFDLRKGRKLGQIPRLDHNFCLSPAPTFLRAVAELQGQKGVQMQLSTTAPGLQAYDGAGLGSHPFPGHMGHPHGPRAGLALGPQHWPDAPGRADFPPILLTPDEAYSQTSEWHFSRRGDG